MVVMAPPHDVPSPAAFVGTLAPTVAKVVGFGKAGSTSLWTMKPVSLAELSVQARSICPGTARSLVAARLEGAGGGTWKMIGRIMSFSS